MSFVTTLPAPGTAPLQINSVRMVLPLLTIFIACPVWARAPQYPFFDIAQAWVILGEVLSKKRAWRSKNIPQQANTETR
jgi:hypothetical protein